MTVALRLPITYNVTHPVHRAAFIMLRGHNF